MTAASRINIRKITVTALMGAAATVLMFVSFGLPFLPPYLKFDFSELPALLASFSLGPVSGAAVCLIKNLFNAFASTTGGIGELCNFLMGLFFVVPAGLIYRKKPSLKGAAAGSAVGLVIMTAGSIFLNYYVVYPAYTLFLPMDAIMDMYKALVPGIDNLWQGLLIFNAPLTFIKCLADVIVTFLVYKKLSPVLKGGRE